MIDKIKSLAYELGFDLCGICEAVPPPYFDSFYVWIQKGLHGSMDYLAREPRRRTNAQLLLPGARSIVCIGASYWMYDMLYRESLTPPNSGLVARYARFEDYHNVLGEKLQTFSEKLRELDPGFETTKWYVDTGPILERAYGMQAGLGFIGKNTSLISPKLGPWIFLGEIITTVQLPTDTPMQVSCGKCTACIEACPTKAIINPYAIDARKCISYLTIEHRGPIPADFHDKIGHRIFGCDECIKACPWNHNNRPGKLMPSFYKSELTWIPLEQILQMTLSTFTRVFGKTPLAYAGLRRLQRNACIVAGNIGTAELLPILQSLSCSNNPILAMHAKQAIARIHERESKT